MCQGLGCSPIQAVRELGSERRETVRSISSKNAKESYLNFSSVREDREECDNGVSVLTMNRVLRDMLGS